ncbi:hypothetical protein ERC79_12485 [Rhodococcus sp. ABRD24]|uniref:hypothetical protein n=1 Tax=Rhodococcus sp. ABRD24 TaxID=2507582 RepID=UPI001038FF96|nr:hypothetical protein [Rhodococcus sp. ABRD24]QBJ96696.1 hypothetical protein ERC79_12485 [Rhodococcus sp. ABRD24]
MARTRWTSERVGELRRFAECGVVRVRDLTAAGMSGSAISFRCRPDGPWQRLLPGLVLLHNGVPTRRERRTAALIYCGPDAMLTGRSALAEHGYSSAESFADVHILIPHERRTHSAGFVVVERTTRLPAPVVRGGLACSPLPRALLDAARRCSTTRSARALIAEAVQRGDVTPATLARELDAGSRRGSALPRKVLEEVSANVHSVAEADARALWQRSGLPTMYFNREIEDGAGAFIAMPDGWIDDVALAWEIDSLDWHLSPDEYEATLARRARMQSAGIIVLAVIPRQLRATPGRALANLRAHYELARSRPRPDLRMRPLPTTRND